MRNKANPLPV